MPAEGTKLTEEGKAVRKIVQVMNSFAKLNKPCTGAHVEAALKILKLDPMKFDLSKVEALEGTINRLQPEAVAASKPSSAKSDTDRELSRTILVSGADKFVRNNWDGHHETLKENMTHLGRHLSRYTYNLGPKAGKEANQEAEAKFMEEIAPDLKKAMKIK